MKRKLVTTLILILTVALTNAHEFWLQPKKFRFAVGEEMKVDFMVGESFTGEFWDMNRHKVEKLDIHSLGVVRNLLSDIKRTAGKNLGYKFIKEGTHLLSLESDAAFDRVESMCWKCRYGVWSADWTHNSKDSINDAALSGLSSVCAGTGHRRRLPA